MQILENSAAMAYSRFANDAERLQVRKAAANDLGLALKGLPDSQVRGPVRTALIKCELASRFGQSHREMDCRFSEVTDLLHQAQLEL